MEVGHWLGFKNPVPVGIVMDLVASPAISAGAFHGTISGLPAVQNVLNVFGSVGSDGSIIIVLVDPSTGGRVGFCDGSVRPIGNFSPGSGQDDLGSLDFSVIDPTGARQNGHMNLLHMFGGLNWQHAGLDWSTIGFPPDPCDGAFLRGGLDTAGGAELDAIQDTSGNAAGGPNTNSAIFGEMKLSLLPFEMVGTVNSRGSIVMMCDGSARDSSALIGLLFTGGVRAGVSPGFNHIVGTFGAGPFDTFLPAVQRSRDGAMSYSWLVPAVSVP